MITVLIFFVGIIMGSFGGLLMKMGANNIGHVQINSAMQLIEYLVKLFTNVQSLAGIFLYFLSAMTWSYLLTKLDISFVQPILALTYVVTPILGIWLLREHVPSMRWVGILVIILGVFIVARTHA